jgi:hypothetical protein
MPLTYELYSQGSVCEMEFLNPEGWNEIGKVYVTKAKTSSTHFIPRFREWHGEAPRAELNFANGRERSFSSIPWRHLLTREN